MIDIREAVAGWVEIFCRDAGQRLKIYVKETDVAQIAIFCAILAAPFVDE